MSAYFTFVRDKIVMHLDTLSDGMPDQAPPGCKHTTMTLILAQFRHACAQPGMINATTVISTGQWPRVIGRDGNGGSLPAQLFE